MGKLNYSPSRLYVKGESMTSTLYCECNCTMTVNTAGYPQTTVSFIHSIHLRSAVCVHSPTCVFGDCRLLLYFSLFTAGLWPSTAMMSCLSSLIEQSYDEWVSDARHLNIHTIRLPTSRSPKFSPAVRPITDDCCIASCRPVNFTPTTFRIGQLKKTVLSLRIRHYSMRFRHARPQGEPESAKHRHLTESYDVNGLFVCCKYPGLLCCTHPYP